MYQLPQLPRGINKSNSYLKEHDHKGFHLLWNPKNVNSGHMIFTTINLDFCAYSHWIRESNCHVFDGSLQIQQFQGKPHHQHDLEQTSAIHNIKKRSSSDRKLEQGCKVCTFPHYKTKGTPIPGNIDWTTVSLGETKEYGTNLTNKEVENIGKDMAGKWRKEKIHHGDVFHSSKQKKCR